MATFLHRRRRRWLIGTLAAAALLVVLVLLDRHGYFLYAGDDRLRYEGRAFDVLRVIDGDTLVIAAPDSRSDGSPDTHVRFWGIDAPEIAQPALAKPADPLGDEAGRFVRSLCDGQRVTLSLEADRVRDKFGRLLAHLRLADGSLLSERVLAVGLARVDERWPHRYLERYAQIEKQAQHDRLGLWSADSMPTVGENP